MFSFTLLTFLPYVTILSSILYYCKVYRIMFSALIPFTKARLDSGVKASNTLTGEYVNYRNIKIPTNW